MAITVNSFVYFSFINSYSTGILSYKEFITQFHSGIYQYRILSGQFLIWMYDFLGKFPIDYSVFKLKFLKESSESRMYISLYILNTIFLGLTAVVMTKITQSIFFCGTKAEKILFPTIAIFIIAITQFVIVPYDCSSYFFLILFLYFFLKYLSIEKKTIYILLAILMIISTLNRESSALSISMVATILYSKYGGISKKMIFQTGIFASIFIFVYVGLRISSGKFTTNDGNLFLENLTQAKNLLGMLFFLLMFALTWMIAENKEQKKLIVVFHIFALPYLLMCFYTGILYEIRLYIPIFLTTVILSRLNLDLLNK